MGRASKRGSMIGGDDEDDFRLPKLGGYTYEETVAGVFRDGNGLAYPHRTGFRPVSDQCLLPHAHAQSMSQCV